MGKKYFIGIDPSIRHIGIVIIQKPNTIVLEKLLIPNGKTEFNYLPEIFENVKSIVETYQPSIVVLEGYAHNKHFKAHQIGEVGGIIKLALIQLKQKTLVIPPRQAKIFITGSGKSTKDLVLLNIYKKYGLEFNNSDLADAYVLSLIGYYYDNYNDKYEFANLTNKQKEVIMKCISKNNK